MTTAVDDLAGALRAAWDGPCDATAMGLSGLERYRPIAKSEDDQTVSDGTRNPLWEAVRWMPATSYYGDAALTPFPSPMCFDTDTYGRLVTMGATRNELAARYAWSIISPSDITWMARLLDGQPVLEIGAGTGYWAWQLAQAGIDVAAYDPHPPGPDNPYCKHETYTTVLPDDASAVRHHPDRALLMVWPPYGGPHARQALAQYKGDLLIYAGEPWGGCTGDDDFYALLEQEWQQVGAAPAHVTWWGIHDRLAAYRRKGGGRA